MPLSDVIVIAIGGKKTNDEKGKFLLLAENLQENIKVFKFQRILLKILEIVLRTRALR